MRELAFDLVSLKVLIQLRNFAERLGREEPDFSGIRIRDPDQDNGNIRIAIGKNSDGLLIGGAVIRIAFGTGAEPPQVAHEGAVHEHLQLFGQVRSLRLAARGAHLQIIGGGLVIPGLRRLQKSKHGSRRRPTSQFIGGCGSRCLSRCPTRQQAGHRLGKQRLAHQPMGGNGSDKNQERQFFHRGSSKRRSARVGTGAPARPS